MTDDEPEDRGPSVEEREGNVPEPPVRNDTTDGKVSIDVEGRFPEIRRLKVSGAVLFIMAGLSAVLPLVLLGGGFKLSPMALTALALAVAGISVGVAGLLSPSIRRPAIFVAPVLLITAAAAGTLGASLDTIPPLELVLAFVFAASWLLAVEHLHAVGRFVELGAYVTRQRLTQFSLGGVIDHFQIYGVGLVTIILAAAAIVIIGVPWVFSKGSSGTFARSVELASVFGIALAAAVVFTLSALILVFVRSVVPQRVDVERVAYSRDRMGDMLRSAQLIERRDEGER
ncbi:MAG: hypothetical protein LN414_08340 [Candidatus Thermoplasmatota archaeon]|nr:hypothetical protein [Candidatus Thermoplasmatota archaeon]